MRSVKETVVPVEEPIVQEMRIVLQEWGAMFKQLYIVSSGVNVLRRTHTQSVRIRTFIDLRYVRCTHRHATLDSSKFV